MAFNIKPKRNRADTEENISLQKILDSFSGPMMFFLVIVAVIFVMSVFFRVSDIQVEGNTHYTDEEIIRAIDIEEGDNLFFFDRFAALSRVFAKLPYVEEVSVERKLPNKVTITVKESQALAYIVLGDEDWTNLVTVADKLNRAPIYIDDTAGITIMDLRSKARRLKAEHGLDLIVIDYLQLMQGRPGKNGDNRQQEISEISRSLKALARELNVPVIALSQLSRSVEARQVKRPMLSDLRESGSLEQDADIVMFLYREDYYDKDTEHKNQTEVIIAKHRNGPVDTVNLYFQKEYTKFRDMIRE